MPNDFGKIEVERVRQSTAFEREAVEWHYAKRRAEGTLPETQPGQEIAMNVDKAVAAYEQHLKQDPAPPAAAPVEEARLTDSADKVLPLAATVSGADIKAGLKDNALLLAPDNEVGGADMLDPAKNYNISAMLQDGNIFGFLIEFMDKIIGQFFPGDMQGAFREKMAELSKQAVELDQKPAPAPADPKPDAEAAPDIEVNRDAPATPPVNMSMTGPQAFFH